jgi:hypothetical protein
LLRRGGSDIVSRSMISATAAASGHARIVEDRQNLLRSHPSFHVDLLASDAVRRFEQRLVLSPTGAKVTLAVRRSLDSDGRGPQVSHGAEKINRVFPVAIFEFPVCRAHGA